MTFTCAVSPLATTVDVIEPQYIRFPVVAASRIAKNVQVVGPDPAAGNVIAVAFWMFDPAADAGKFVVFAVTATRA